MDDMTYVLSTVGVGEEQRAQIQVGERTAQTVTRSDTRDNDEGGVLTTRLLSTMYYHWESGTR